LAVPTINFRPQASPFLFEWFYQLLLSLFDLLIEVAKLPLTIKDVCPEIVPLTCQLLNPGFNLSFFINEMGLDEGSERLAPQMLS
jgi:hypothetical protein